MLVQQAFMKFHLNITMMYLKNQRPQHEMHHKESSIRGLNIVFLLGCNKMLMYFEVNIGLLDHWLVTNTWTRNIYCFRKMGLFIVITLKTCYQYFKMYRAGYFKRNVFHWVQQAYASNDCGF